MFSSLNISRETYETGIDINIGTRGKQKIGSRKEIHDDMVSPELPYQVNKEKKVVPSPEKKSSFEPKLIESDNEEKFLEQKIELKGLNEYLTEYYEGGKQIFESLIEIPVDSNPIMETQHYEDGNKYEGELINGKRNGFGTYYFSSGSKYVGEWKNNLFEGQGKMYYFNGNVYSGSWEKGQKHGNGTMTSKNGNVYNGQWVNDQREGFGKNF